jgi:hypothetical protein
MVKEKPFNDSTFRTAKARDRKNSIKTGAIILKFPKIHKTRARIPVLMAMAAMIFLYIAVIISPK